MGALERRALGPEDEEMLRAFWAERPQAHIFAIPDLDHFGWDDLYLHYFGWFDGAAMVATAMIYGTSVQWEYRDARALPDLAGLLDEREVRFASGLEAQLLPALERLPAGRIEYREPSTVARLPVGCFEAATLARSPGRVRRATLADLDALARLHVAAPDQFNHFDLPTRRRMLRGALTDGWRRLFLAETPDGEIVASAQSSAEGRDLAVVGGVVTHPRWRGLGYGTAVTAHLSAALLADGLTPYLYFRRGNLPAERAYRAIGYEMLDDVLLVKLRAGR